MHLIETQIIPATLIVQDGEYLIISEDLRTLARPEEIGYIAYRKQSRGFHIPQDAAPEYDIVRATPSHLKHIAERNGGELQLFANPDGTPLIYNNLIIIK